MPQCITLSFYRFNQFRDRAWAFLQMGLARRELGKIGGLSFWKLCGSGTGEGFTPIPNTAVWAILAVWDSEEIAIEQTQASSPFKSFARRSDEAWTIRMEAVSTRGAWSGKTPFTSRHTDHFGPLAALTRANVRLGAIRKFWSRSPSISQVIGSNRDVIFKIGIGEIPWFSQVTFSIWPDPEAIIRFARSGHHGEAIKAVRAEGWFREELYARFRILGDAGTWGGASPLTAQRDPA